MDILKLALVCVLILLPLAILKKYSAEQAVLVTIAAAVFVVFRLIAYLTPLLGTMEELYRRAGIDGSQIAILFRTVAASLITHLCADLCRDGGSQTMATLVEIAGTVTVLLIAMPLLEAVTELLLGYFS